MQKAAGRGHSRLLASAATRTPFTLAMRTSVGLSRRGLRARKTRDEEIWLCREWIGASGCCSRRPRRKSWFLLPSFGLSLVLL